ncbi:hypothetical protein HPB48_023655 [Haemaphysalis longicornis]|uniref:Uncharacterized protein n=1 Tax=Haemaphysalis longicornis TaxID=44386 RepID=A0A9J6H5S2_HAELO|nr:hypothetical protein HPB48_023655 [Haemaphysalis longicornis]
MLQISNDTCIGIIYEIYRKVVAVSSMALQVQKQAPQNDHVHQGNRSSLLCYQLARLECR